MAQITYTLSSGDVTVAVTITEQAGALAFDLQVMGEGGTIGDLNALFLDFADASLIDGLAATGDDVTGAAFKDDGVTRIDHFTNVAGAVTRDLGKFDIGVQFGTQGIGVDDIRSTSFVLEHGTLDLTLDDVLLMDSAVRLTSVGEEGGVREDSLKIGGSVVPVEGVDPDGPVEDGPEVEGDGPVIGGEGPDGEGPVGEDGPVVGEEPPLEDGPVIGGEGPVSEDGPVLEGPVVGEDGPVLDPGVALGEDDAFVFADVPLEPAPEPVLAAQESVAEVPMAPDVVDTEVVIAFDGVMLDDEWVFV